MLLQSTEFGEVQERQERGGIFKEFCNQFICYDLVHLTVVVRTLVGDLV
jgi:hypothetical protein